MRVFLPDDRKIAAKPQHLEEQQQQQQQQPRKKKFKSDNNSSNSSIIMGGGGRLMGGPPSSPAALKSGKSGGAAGNTRDNGQQEQESSSDALVDGRGDLRLGPNRLVGNHAPHAAVAAAAASPHRSTLNTAGRAHGNPEDDDDDEWQDNDAKQSSSRYIYHLGKSNNKNENTILKQSSNQNHTIRRYTATSNSSSTVMQSLAATARTPLLDGPIPGSREDPATMSKTNQGEDDNDENCTILSQFTHLLRSHKPPLDIIEMEGDGNCLFRAISLQVYGDATMHMEVRRHCLDFMEREANHFRDFVADEEFTEYIARKRMEGVHGNHTEIQAMSELYRRQIEVFVPNGDQDDGPVEPINIFHSEYKSVDAPHSTLLHGWESL